MTRNKAKREIFTIWTLPDDIYGAREKKLYLLWQSYMLTIGNCHYYPPQSLCFKCSPTLSP